MTLNRKNNHTNAISVFKLVENEVLHEILGLFCQKLKIQYGRRQPFWIYANKHMKEKNERSPLHQILFYICWMTCVQNFITLSGFKLSCGVYHKAKGQVGMDWFEPCPGGYIISLKQKKQVVLTGRFVKYGNRLGTHWF